MQLIDRAKIDVGAEMRPPISRTHEPISIAPLGYRNVTGPEER
jgi:hypothetical protein